MQISSSKLNGKNKHRRSLTYCILHCRDPKILSSRSILLTAGTSLSVEVSRQTSGPRVCYSSTSNILLSLPIPISLFQVPRQQLLLNFDEFLLRWQRWQWHKIPRPRNLSVQEFLVFDEVHYVLEKCCDVVARV